MDGRTVSEGKNVIDAAFSPKTGFLYFIEADSGSSGGAIYKTKMYMYDEIPVISRDGSARRDLSVSEDGRTLIFCSDRSGKWQVYTYDLSAEAPLMRITPADANHRLPRISPDGKYIAYLSDQTGFGGKMDLWVYDRKKVTYQQITTHANVRDFAWKDDSRTIYFSSGVNIPDINSTDIFNKQAGIKKMLPSQKTWGESAPRFIRYKNSPKIVYTREYINGKKELRWFDTRTMVDEALFKQGNYNEWIE
jgi:dipeptidyl aminopeptidase/acylaminoacyl peptidase